MSIRLCVALGCDSILDSNLPVFDPDAAWPVDSVGDMPPEPTLCWEHRRDFMERGLLTADGRWLSVPEEFKL